mgnify:CR=1 FL=1
MARGIWPEFHGKKVGVATLMLDRIYRNIAEKVTEIRPIPDPTDWDEVYSHFLPQQIPEVKDLNSPCITDLIDLEKLRESWGEIRRMILEDLPKPCVLEDLMRRAGCAVTPDEINVSPELVEEGLKYHFYMRYRVLLTRLMLLMGVDPMDHI